MEHDGSKSMALDALPRFIPVEKARLGCGAAGGPTCVGRYQANCRAAIRIRCGAGRTGSCWSSNRRYDLPSGQLVHARCSDSRSRTRSRSWAPGSGILGSALECSLASPLAVDRLARQHSPCWTPAKLASDVVHTHPYREGLVPFC